MKFKLFLIFPILFGLSLIKNKIVQTYQQFSDSFYFQKIYLHTDKDIYFVGEKIWFKIYLYNAQSKTLEKRQHSVFVELINNEKKIIAVKIFKIKNGIAYNSFEIPDSFPTGFYLLRAYSDVMKNYPENYFFKKRIFIQTFHNEFSKNFWSQVKKKRRQHRKVFFEYYSEGGHLSLNLPNHILLELYDYQNNTFDSATIEIYDKNKLIKKLFLKNGFCDFYFKPSKKKYKILVKTAKKIYRFKLKFTEYNYSLLSRWTEKFIEFTVYKKQSLTKDSIGNQLYVIGEQNGNLFLLQTLTVYDSNSIKIDQKNIPYGISRFLFLDAEGNPILERIIYKKPKFQKTVNLKIEQQKNQIKLHLKPQIQDTFHISIAILDKKRQPSENIFNELMINSDLKKKINFGIFSEKDPQTINKILIREKWDKYHWEKYINSDSITQIKYKPMQGIEISGYISRLLEGIPAKNVPVKLIILSSYNDIYYTTTNKKGRFKFKNLDYYDTIEFVLKSENYRGKRLVVISVDVYDTISPNFDNIGNPFLEIYRPKYIKYHRKKYKRELGTLHSRADQIFYGDEIIASGTTNVLDFLKGRVAGYDEGHFRGYHSFRLSSEPLYLIDNLPVSRGAVANLNPQDIDRIEIIRSSTAIYGQRGANGVIAIYTKKGYNIIWCKYVGKTTGFSKNENFVYQNSENIIKTLYWLPEITVFSDTTITIVLPKKSEKFYLNAQGLSQKGNFFVYSTNF